jgi:predicted RNA-binding Zn-ribbon protein involved in translation (DUF1610 family)
MILVTIVLLVVKFSKKQEEMVYKSIEEFEKTLKGRLYHFQCQNCQGIFAIKKSKKNNKKSVKLTCPDCGCIGVIPPVPKKIEMKIPKQKSINANFRCNNCGEKVTIWAEGTKLYECTSVFSCPYCGETKPMSRIS